MTNKEKRFEMLTKAATVFSKLFEVGYQILAIGMMVGLVLFVIDKSFDWGALVRGNPEIGEQLAVNGFSIVIGNSDGTLNNAATIIFLLAGAMSGELMAWVFRNVNLVLRTTQGLTKFSQGKTPFQKDNVRMIREIGIFFISITVVHFALSSLAVLIIGPEMAEVSVGMGNIVAGVLMLCLSQVFALGQKMQEDVDGLV